MYTNSGDRVYILLYKQLYKLYTSVKSYYTGYTSMLIVVLRIAVLHFSIANSSIDNHTSYIPNVDRIISSNTNGSINNHASYTLVLIIVMLITSQVIP